MGASVGISLLDMNQDVLSRAMKSMAARIKHYQDKLPDEWEWGDDQEVDDAVDAILAIEGEWLVNMDQRRAFSVLEGWEESDDE